jgi:hypothetical protein
MLRYGLCVQIGSGVAKKDNENPAVIHIGDGSFFNAKRKQTTDILSGPNQTLQLTSAAVSVPAWFKLPVAAAAAELCR